MSKKQIQKEYNGYAFYDSDIRKKMRYLIVVEGDLCPNTIYTVRTQKELKSCLKKHEKSPYLVEAIFRIKDITRKYLK